MLTLIWPDLRPTMIVLPSTLNLQTVILEPKLKLLLKELPFNPSKTYGNQEKSSRES